MKRYARVVAAAFALWCFITGAAFCQHRFAVGLQAGINNADADVDPLADGVHASIRGGLLLGAHVEYRWNESLALSISPRFIEKGARFHYRDALVETALLNYIETAFAFRYTPVPRRLAPYLFAGMSIAALVSARYVTEFQRGESVQYVEEFTRTLDISLDAGAGFEYRISTAVSLGCGVGYSHGLVNVVLPATGNHYATWYSRDLKVASSLLVWL